MFEISNVLTKTEAKTLLQLTKQYASLHSAIRLLVFFFKPHNILTNAEKAGISYISYNSNFHQEDAELELVNNTEYDERKVLECIAKYKECREILSEMSY